MNIIFIAPKINLSGGGSNSNTDLRIKTLKESGHNVKIVTLFSKYNKLPEKNPYEIIPYNKKPKRWIFVNFFVFRILKKYQKEADLFYLDGPQFLWGAGFYRLFGKKPIMIHLNVLPYAILEHGTGLYAEKDIKIPLVKKIKFWIRSKIGGYIDIYFSNKMDGLTCTSPIIREQCIEFGLKESNLYLLPEFIDTKIFVQNKSKESLMDTKKNLLYVGRLVPCKGVDLLVKAVGSLKEKGIMLDIVGDGPELPRLKSISAAMGLDDYIRFHGWIERDRLREIYSRADIFVHPARWAEPLGITIVEAMAVGLPVIVPKMSGSVWAAGKAGLTFQNGDEQDLKKKIEMLLGNETLYRKLKAHTEEETRKMDYNKWAGKFENLITKLAEG